MNFFAQTVPKTHAFLANLNKTTARPIEIHDYSDDEHQSIGQYGCEKEVTTLAQTTSIPNEEEGDYRDCKRRIKMLSGTWFCIALRRSLERSITSLSDWIKRPVVAGRSSFASTFRHLHPKLTLHLFRPAYHDVQLCLIDSNSEEFEAKVDIFLQQTGLLLMGSTDGPSPPVNLKHGCLTISYPAVLKLSKGPFIAARFL